MEYTILILLLPLLSFLFLGLAGMKLKPVVAGAIGTAVLAVVALLSYCTAFEYFSAGRDASGVFPTLVPWNTVGLPISRTLHIDLGILLDPISVMMLVVISTVSLMVHVYSLGYMKGERGVQRYYAFLSLFTMSMMGLVVATNIFQMYLFWELVGVSSYLLIGFYYTKKEAVAASKKAFIVTRFADLGFLVGILFYGYYAGTFSFTPDVQLLAAAGAMIPLALGLMFIGGAGKSAMFPLHIWLPKAHPVAPAPASALLSGILTKSGVFGLIVLCANLMQGNAAFGNALMIFAAITMFLGALLALFSTDLKRTLACSSMSQIGFITLGLSVMVLLGDEGTLAAYGSVMHMLNHSLIKLTLFIAAGVVYMNLHALNLDDIRGFGRKKPLLHIAFLLGALSIACIPPLGSGYNSKSLLHEGLLELIGEMQAAGSAWMGYKAIEVLFLISGGLTVAYMAKLYICIFWQKHPTRQAEFDAMTHYMNGTTAFALLGSAAALPFLGALPGLLLTPFGAKSASFFGVPALKEAIAYFSAENLQGAAISIIIGAAVYLLIVLPLLTRKDEGGVRLYVNRWNEKLDLENAVYRPLLLTLLPQVLTLVFRFIAELPENLVMASRATIFRMRKTRKPVPVGNRFTYTLGRALNALARLLNRTILHRHPMRTDFEYVLDASFREISGGIRSMSVSISFGLLLLCIGLYVTCLYLLQ